MWSLRIAHLVCCLRNVVFRKYFKWCFYMLIYLRRVDYSTTTLWTGLVPIAGCMVNLYYYYVLLKCLYLMPNMIFCFPLFTMSTAVQKGIKYKPHYNARRRLTAARIVLNTSCSKNISFSKRESFKNKLKKHTHQTNKETMFYSAYSLTVIFFLPIFNV